MRAIRFIFPALLVCFSFSCTTKTASENSASDSIPAQEVNLPDTQPVSIDTPEVEPVPIEHLLGKIDQSSDPDFVHIDPKYTNKPRIFLRKAAYEAFLSMRAAAEADGIRLEIVSATRNFNYQRGIWERKWTGVTKVEGQNLAKKTKDPVQRAETILRYSSMPGTSRHHWGTDIDLNSLNNSYFESGVGKKVYDWLQANAGNFGYCQTYTVMDETRPHGYQEEKWHWSYMPIAGRFLEAYLAQVSYTELTGFKGAEAAEGLGVIQKYVAGIGPKCREW